MGSTFSSDADAAHKHSPVTLANIRNAVCPEHLWDWWNDDQQRQWLQVQPWNNADSWNQHGIVASRTGHQQNLSWDQCNRWNANDWNQWSSWSARGNDDGWSSRSQWHSEPKKYFDKSRRPEWDGNHPEKTWRDYRRTVKQRLSTTDVPSERHGMLLWRALSGDPSFSSRTFVMKDLLCWDAGLAQAHKHVSEFDDQDDFDSAFHKLHRERNQTLPAVCECGQGCLSAARHLWLPFA